MFRRELKTGVRDLETPSHVGGYSHPGRVYNMRRTVGQKENSRKPQPLRGSWKKRVKLEGEEKTWKVCLCGWGVGSIRIKGNGH